MRVQTGEEVKQRESNYDLLRILAALAVITIHVSSTYKAAITDDYMFAQFYRTHIFTTILYNTLSRFAVPCFAMLSGAFLLSDERNANYMYFYKKSFKNIGVQTFIFSILYFLFSLMQAIMAIKINGREWTRILDPIEELIKGVPYYHMWYLYVVIGAYLLVPIVIRIKRDFAEKTFTRIVRGFFIVACLSLCTSGHQLEWDIGKSFCYLGYFMVGYELRKWAYNRKNNRKGGLFISLGILLELIVSCSQYQHSLNGISESAEPYSLIGPAAPLIASASILIFAGFSLLHINANLGKMASYTFLIYLFHAGVWKIGTSMIIRPFGANWDNRVVIPVSILCVAIISYLLAKIYLRIWRVIDSKMNLTNKLCKFVRLK